MEEKIDRILKDVQEIKADQQTVKTNVNKILADNSVTQERMKALEQSNKLLARDTRRLQADLGDIQQKMRENWIEISGIPPNYDNLMEIPAQIARYTGHVLEVDAVTDVSRVRRRPSTVIYVFKQIRVKLDFLEWTKKFRLYTTDILSDQRDRTRIFINESLVPIKYQLFKQVKLLQKTNVIKFAWSKNGKILARIHESAPTKVIITVEDVEKIKAEATKTNTAQSKENNPANAVSVNQTNSRYEKKQSENDNVSDRETQRKTKTDGNSSAPSQHNQLVSPACQQCSPMKIDASQEEYTSGEEGEELRSSLRRSSRQSTIGDWCKTALEKRKKNESSPPDRYRKKQKNSGTDK